MYCSKSYSVLRIRFIFCEIKSFEIDCERMTDKQERKYQLYIPYQGYRTGFCMLC